MSQSEQTRKALSNTGSAEIVFAETGNAAQSQVVENLNTGSETGEGAAETSGDLQATQDYVEQESRSDEPALISDRDYRAQERIVIEHIQSFDEACKQRHRDREAIPVEEVHTLLSHAVKQLNILKKYQMSKRHYALDTDERLDWDHSIKLTETRAKNIVQRYENHVRETAENPPADRDNRSRRSSKHGRSSRTSSRYSLSTVSSSIRARMDMDAQRIELEKKTKEMELKSKLADLNAEMARQKALANIELDRQKEACELQLEVNESAARFEKARMEVHYLEEGGSQVNIPAQNRPAVEIHGPAVATRQIPDVGTDRQAGASQPPPQKNHGPAKPIYMESSSSPHTEKAGGSYPLEKDSLLNVDAPNYGPSRSLGHEILPPNQPTVQSTSPRNHDFDFTPPRNPSDSGSSHQLNKSTEVVDKLLLKQLSDKKTEETKFDGNPLNYLSFRNEFNLLIKRFPDDPAYLFSALENCLVGNAKNDIRHCKDLLHDPANALDTALTVLKRNYGSDHKVRRAHLDHLCDRNKAIKGDADSMRNLLSDLERSKILLRMDEHSLYLNSPDTIKAIMHRLPDNIKANFVRSTNKLNNPANPGFQFLIKFVNKECQYACNPFADLLTQSKYTAKSKDKFKDTNKVRHRVNTIGTGVNNKDANANKQEKSEKARSDSTGQREHPKFICPLCRPTANHRLQDCQSFKSMSVDERWNFLDHGSRVCYSCLHPGHKSSACRSKYSCQGCRSKRHHTMLCKREEEPVTNSDAPQENNQAQSFAVTVVKENNHQVYTRVLPVEVFSTNGNKCTVYALLDSGADITIATQSLANKLHLDGRENTLSLEGVHGVRDVLAKHVSFFVKGIGELSDDKYLLNKVACLPSLPSHTTSIPTGESLHGHDHLKDLRFPTLSSNCVDLIIGTDNKKLHEVIESRYAETSRLCAHLTPLGWLLAGVDTNEYTLDSDDETNYTNSYFCSRCISREFEVCDCNRTLDAVKLMLEGFEKSDRDEEKDLSLEDEKVLQLFDQEHKKVNGHNELPLPFRKPDKPLPNNYKLAYKRLSSLKKRLTENPELLKFFKDKFNDYLDKGYIERIDEAQAIAEPNRVYYLPYFCTSQDKPRIVYDGSANFNGSSLNKILMSGPDLMQPLIDVLLRFRQDRVAFVCDIKEMFLQVKLAPADQDSVRILWYTDGNLNAQVSSYKFKVHPFGLNSSPAAAIYSLRQCAMDNEVGVSRDTVNTVLTQFYMDDGLVSEKSEEDALTRMEELKQLLDGYGFKLAKVLSNSDTVHDNLESKDLIPELHDLQAKENGIPQHKTLGIVWNPKYDDLVIKVHIKEKPRTKRGLLSMISQLFDPLGICQPYILQARHIMQDTFTTESDDWDEALPHEIQERCDKWLKDVSHLNKLKIPRCYHIDGDRPFRYQLHTFSDASTNGLGAVSYLRFWKNNQWDCAFVRGKGRLIPKNNTCSVARLELEAAVMGAQLQFDVLEALDLPIERENSLLWTDSTTVLSWIQNPSRRTKVYIGNRRRKIHRLTDYAQWRYVSTALNPADMATRATSPKNADPFSPWLKGPKFLTSNEEHWNMPKPMPSPDTDFEWAPNSVNTAGLQPQSEDTDNGASPLFSLLWEYSDIYELKRRFAWLRRFKQWIMNKKQTTTNITGSLNLEELDKAMIDIIKLAQEEFYSKKILTNIAEHGMEATIKKCNDKYVATHLKSLLKLTPFIDTFGILRVGGRLQNSDLPEKTKHQFILPKRHHITKLLVEESHQHNAHFGGVQQTLADMQQRYWIAPCDVNYYLKRCLNCEILRMQPGKQIMAPLPTDRVSHGKHPFEATGVDYFGPILVSVNRSTQKRWIALFTCMSTRGVHLEVVHSLTTSSFLQALFRFNNAHGNPLKKLISDNATTFHGADDELKTALTRLGSENTRRQLQRKNIEWQFNAPLASHQGGVWERLIRSIRKILSGLPAFQRTTPNDENLLTVLKEAEAIINARPLTPIRGEADEFAALTPAMILTGCLGNNTPVDTFHKEDEFKKDWRYTQIAADQFWNRFVKEYLSCLQLKAKWFTDGQNLSIGDLVLLKDQTMVRQDFPKALVTDVYPGKDGKVRNIQVRLADGRKFTRDIRKVIPLELVNENKKEAKN